METFRGSVGIIQHETGGPVTILLDGWRDADDPHPFDEDDPDILRARITIGERGLGGELLVQDGQGGGSSPAVYLSGEDKTMVFGDNLFTDQPAHRIAIDWQSGAIKIDPPPFLIHEGRIPPGLTVGPTHLDRMGVLTMHDPSDDNVETVRLDPNVGKIRLANGAILLDGGSGNIRLGGARRADGDLIVENKSGQRRIHLDGGGTGGRAAADAVIYANGATGNLRLGGSGGRGEGKDGDLLLEDADGRRTIHLDAGGGPVLDETRVYIDGVNGDIVLQNADCAEEFDAAEADLDPGSVVVMNGDARLEMSRKEYDRRVAGVVAGGAGEHPGIVLGRQPMNRGRIPIALMGKVFCKVDASYGDIVVGDLLTTSCTPGHAKKVNDPLDALGAVIGKALGSHREGSGLIPVLVSLQ